VTFTSLTHVDAAKLMDMTQHEATSSTQSKWYSLLLMLLLLTESTLFFLDLALASRATSSPDSSSVVNWATNVADARQQPGATEQASAISQSRSKLTPHHRAVHSRTTLAATSVSNRSRSLQPSMNAAVEDNEIFGDTVNAADERAAMVASFQNCTKNLLASNPHFT